MEKTEYEQKKSELDDNKIFSMREWKENEKSWNNAICFFVTIAVVIGIVIGYCIWC